jgi:hypothetical protein
MFQSDRVLLFFLIFFSLSARQSLAQLETDRPERLFMDRKNIYQGQTDDYSGTANISSGVELNSTAVTNSFVKALLFRGFLTDNVKDDVSAKLKSSNRIGLDFNAGLSGTYHTGALTFIAGINDREHFDAGFSKDLFEVLFRGNKNYAGKTAVLAPAKINYFNYQSLFMGLSKQLASSHFILGGGISFINGGQYQQINLHRANLYTSDDGEYIDLNTSFNVNYTNRQKSTIPSGGAGLAMNLNLSHWGERHRFNVELHDFGFIRWKSVNTLHADSSLRYEGVEVANILDYGEYTYNGLNADSLKKQYHVSQKVSSINQWIPFSFNLNYTYLYSPKLNVVFGGKYLAFANYFPSVYIRTLYYMKENFMLAPAIIYGGYGGWNLEISAVKSFKNKFIISGSVICLEYLLLPSKTQGYGAQLSLTKIF